MVQVSADTFLTKVAELYEQTTSASKGSVALSCKSVPVKKIAKQNALGGTVDHVLLFRVCKYGNNKHKKKYSTMISATGHAQFHTSLSQIVKTKIDVAISKDIAGGSAKRLAKVKKTTE
uniref:Signal recognition particle 14 kDa protein n=1 Tax=Globisporangium ultimum (strain ATCC 200006 / CBS 805.95 / DAOM BR144) TaxID=431595 RepID=K3WSX2_GLOUD